MISFSLSFVRLSFVRRVVVVGMMILTCVSAGKAMAYHGADSSSKAGTQVAFKTISPKSVRALLDTACHTVIIDVRSEKEFMSETGHLDDARRIGYDSISARVKEIEEFKDRPILVYCRTGGRGAKAAESLVKQGFTQVYNLDGGIMAWDKAGMIVVREKQSTQTMPKK